MASTQNILKQQLYRFLGGVANNAATTVRNVATEAAGPDLSDSVNTLSTAAINTALNTLSSLIQAYDPTFPPIPPINSTFADVNNRVALVNAAMIKLRDIMKAKWLIPLNKLRALNPRKAGETIDSWLARLAALNDTAILAQLCQDTLAKYKAVVPASSPISGGPDDLQPVAEPEIGTALAIGPNSAYDTELREQAAETYLNSAVQAFLRLLDHMHPDAEVGGWGGQIPAFGGRVAQNLAWFGDSASATPAGLTRWNKTITLAVPAPTSGADSITWFFRGQDYNDGMITKGRRYTIRWQVWVSGIVGNFTVHWNFGGPSAAFAFTSVSAERQELGWYQSDFEVPVSATTAGDQVTAALYIDTAGNNIAAYGFSGELISVPNRDAKVSDLWWRNSVLSSDPMRVAQGAHWSQYLGNLNSYMGSSPGTLDYAASQLMSDQRQWQLVLDALERAGEAGHPLTIPDHPDPQYSTVGGGLAAVRAIKFGPSDLLRRDGLMTNGGAQLSVPQQRAVFDALAGWARMIQDGHRLKDPVLASSVAPFVAARCDL